MDEQMNQRTPEPTYVTFEGDGAPQPVQQSYVSYTDQPTPMTESPRAEKQEGGTSGLSIASMILGISSLAGWIVTCGSMSIPAAVLAVIFGLVGRVNGQITRQGKTGLICGIISLGIFVLAVILLIAVFAFMLLLAPEGMREAFLEGVSEAVEAYY